MSINSHDHHAVTVIARHQLSTNQKEELEDVVDEAMSDYFLQSDGDVTSHPRNRLAIVYRANGSIIGFLSPKRMNIKGEKYYRTGALYLQPAYRDKGIMEQVLKEFFAARRPGIAWIDDHNHKSINLFKKIGFEKDKPLCFEGACGHWYVLSGLVEALESNPPTFSW